MIDRRRFAAALAGAIAGPPSLAHAASGTVANVDERPVSVTDEKFGAKGDGKTDDTAAIQAAIDFCFGSADAPHAQAAERNRPLYFPPGIYNISAPLLLTRVMGAHIFGAGRFATRIHQKTPDASVFITNGFQYSRFESMYLHAAGSGTVFDMSWDGKPPVALQEVIFKDLYIEGGAVGINIGSGGFMGSENLFLSCFFSRCSVAGLKTSNFNALQNSLVAGDFQACRRGIWVAAGSVPGVFSVGFQESSDFDIQVDNAVKDSMQIIGCRTESKNFVRVDNNPVFVTMVGCSQLTSVEGIFIAAGSSQATLIGCASTMGLVDALAPQLVVQQCRFDRDPWHNLSYFQPDSFVDISNLRYGPKDRYIARRRITASGEIDGPAPRYREVTTGGAVNLEPADEIIGINKPVGTPTTVRLGPAARRYGVPITIKDIKGDAANNAITPEFSDGELCDGKPGESFAVNQAFGAVTFYPRPGGWYRLS
jgi:hypothetical protein